MFWFVCDSSFSCGDGSVPRAVGVVLGLGLVALVVTKANEDADAHDEDDGGDGCDDGDGGVDDDSDASSVHLVWLCAQHLPQLVE